MIASLPPREAEAVLLRAVIGLDAETAGRVLGRRAGAVRTAAHRGLRRLALLLDQQGTAGARGDAVSGAGDVPAGPRAEARPRQRAGLPPQTEPVDG
ncbi:hypothetical protein GCM10029963_16000 [Micromonospora andamanensis]